MRKTANILLFLFILFLITPTVVSAIENDSDFSVVSSFSEEEKEVKDGMFLCHFNPFKPTIYSSTKVNTVISSNHILKHDEISVTIFTPPPELI